MIPLLIVHRDEQELCGEASGPQRAKEKAGSNEQPPTRIGHAER
jgi:hypothetical protein